MTDGERMFSGVAVRRAVAAEGHAAGLASSQMDPWRTYLHTLFTDKLCGKFDSSNCCDVFAGFSSHILECGDSTTPARLPRRGPRLSLLWSLWSAATRRGFFLSLSSTPSPAH